MARQLFVKLQTPTIELPVQAKDSADSSASITVGFKRYTIQEAEGKLKEFMAALDNPADDSYLRGQIVYIKNASLEVYEIDENGNASAEPIEEILISDSRTPTPNEFFQDASTCLNVLVDKYVNSVPWKNSLYEALQKALLNTDYKDAQIKN